jgi:magnesium chelatase subunit I
MHSVVQWFELGGKLKYSADAPAEEVYGHLKKIQGLFEKTQSLGVKPKDDPALLVSAAEFVLEGLYSLKKISRNEEVGYFVEAPRPSRSETRDDDLGLPPGPRRRPLN